MIIDFNYWLKVFKKVFAFISSILLVYIGFKVSVFYIPFLIAFILAQLIEPIIRFCMRKFKMRRRLSAVLIFFVLLSFIIGLIVWGAITLITEVNNFLSNFNYYFDKVSEVTQNLISNFDFNKIQISDDIKNIISNSSSDIIRFRF